MLAIQRYLGQHSLQELLGDWAFAWFIGVAPREFSDNFTDHLFQFQNDLLQELGNVGTPVVHSLLNSHDEEAIVVGCLCRHSHHRQREVSDFHVEHEFDLNGYR